jgi:hypothetical protein
VDNKLLPAHLQHTAPVLADRSSTISSTSSSIQQSGEMINSQQRHRRRQQPHKHGGLHPAKTARNAQLAAALRGASLCRNGFSPESLPRGLEWN